MATEKRLIDANELLRSADRYFFWSADEVRRFIATAPAVDAVEVVRCKDCKHWHKNGSGCGWCEAWEGGRFHDNFCNYGERKENG